MTDQTTTSLKKTFLPELGIPYRGKVREVYDQGKTLTMIASDRVSVFDVVLSSSIPDKGRILTQMSQFWFQKTQDIVPNHLLSLPDPNVMLVKKCRALPIEVIVRGYLAGSMWRDYAAGKRVKCGVHLPDGLKQNDKLPHPIVTPTTKNPTGHDEDISEEDILAKEIVEPALWKQIKTIALKLYERGQEILTSKGILLIDTKYEFGLDEHGQLTLIDEIHTPDSSRFRYENPQQTQQIQYPDKEFIRDWMRTQGFVGEGQPPHLPETVVQQARQIYLDVYKTITGKELHLESSNTSRRVLHNLKEKRLLKGVFALILMGSEKDQEHVNKMTAVLAENGIPYKAIVASAHKHPQRVADLIASYNESLEPIVCITVAGRSNALSGVVAANLKWPVIAAPPFKDFSDYLTNIHSSLQMPSSVPVMTVIDPVNAALATIRILKTMEMVP